MQGISLVAVAKAVPGTTLGLSVALHYTKQRVWRDEDRNQCSLFPSLHYSWKPKLLNLDSRRSMSVWNNVKIESYKPSAALFSFSSLSIVANRWMSTGLNESVKDQDDRSAAENASSAITFSCFKWNRLRYRIMAQPTHCINIRDTWKPPEGCEERVSNNHTTQGDSPAAQLPIALPALVEDDRSASVITFPYTIPSGSTVRFYDGVVKPWWRVLLGGVCLFLILSAWGVSLFAPFFISWWFFREAKSMLSRQGSSTTTDLGALNARLRHVYICLKQCLDGLIHELKGSKDPFFVSQFLKSFKCLSSIADQEISVSLLGWFSLVYLTLIAYFWLLDCGRAAIWRPRPYPLARNPDNSFWTHRVLCWLSKKALDWFPAGSSVVIEDYKSFLASARGEATPTILCYHPHGIIAQGFMYLTALPELDGYKLLGAPIIRFCPLLRLLLNNGRVELGSAGRDAMTKTLTSKRNVLLVPGGLQEASLTEFGKEKLYLQNRKGFICYALKYGYSLTPVYAFGENLSYSQFSNRGTRFRFALNQRWIPTVFAYGDWRTPFGLLPKRHPWLIVVGKPLQLPLIENPSREDVDTYHRIYINEVRRLYTTYAESYYEFCAREHSLNLPSTNPKEDQRGVRASQSAPVLQIW